MQCDRPPADGRCLYQSSFFFCTVRAIGDTPGMGPIYVEVAVDRDSGVGFAKVYSSRGATNAVDLLASRAIPFFERLHQKISEIHTRRTSEYRGLVSKHPFAAFLATSRIQHLTMNSSDHPFYYLCEQFYWHLLEEFFPPALRRKFELSLEELQRDLDRFVAAYNSGKLHEDTCSDAAPAVTANFPVDL
jgi:hypothetical protein